MIEKIENYQKAKTLLDDAKLLLEHKRFNSAISRAYYALYQFSIYILAQHGETRPKDNWTHNKMPKVLDQKQITINDISVADTLRIAYSGRVIADYKTQDVSPKQVTEIINDIIKIIK